jgi:hypothetical protein
MITAELVSSNPRMNNAANYRPRPRPRSGVAVGQPHGLERPEIVELWVVHSWEEHIFEDEDENDCNPRTTKPSLI